jgi:HEAT repeat protein
MPVLIAVLRSDQAIEPRVAAVEALARFRGAVEATDELIEACESSDVGLSNAALTALGRVGAADPNVLPALRHGLKKDATLVSAANSLAAMGTAARDAEPDLIAALSRIEPFEESRRIEVWTLKAALASVTGSATE